MSPRFTFSVACSIALIVLSIRIRRVSVNFPRVLLDGIARGRFTAAPNVGLTLHLSVIPKEISQLQDVPEKFVFPMRQCFSHIMIVIDPPHGGKTYAYDRQSEPVYLPSPKKLLSCVESNMYIRDALWNIERTTALLRSRCANDVTTSAVVLNHTDLEKSFLPSVLDLSGPAVHDSTFNYYRSFEDVRTDLPVSQRMWKNSAMYIWSLTHAPSRYLVHIDIDLSALSNGRHLVTPWVPSFQRKYSPPIRFWPLPDPDWLTKGVSQIQEDSSVAFVMPRRCSESAGYVKNKHLSTRIFLADCTHFKDMIPLKAWADHIEELIGENMRSYDVNVVSLAYTTPCTWD